MKTAILGPDGRPYKRVASPPSPESISAYLDVAHTTSQNAEHWGMTRAGDANVAFNYGVRKRSRDRARYETANNCYLQGLVDTKTSDLIGEVTLQVTTGESEEIERAWNTWAEEICLLEKLDILFGAGKMTSGEGIGLIVENPQVVHPIKLDMIVLESEQLGNPFGIADDYTLYDGIRHDNGHPLSYYIYEYHPEAHHRFNPMPYVGDWYDAERVVHVFRRYRIGQLRGATELKAALDMAAILRRYIMAEISAAELAAETAMVLETDAPAEVAPPTLSSSCEFMPWQRNMLYTTPYGWKLKQLKAEQPTEDSDKFIRAIATQMGYSVGVPSILATGDASDYNMASGRLDVQAYIRRLNSDRRRCVEPQCLEKLFLAFMRYYASMRSGISPADIDQQVITEEYPHRWAYRPINHSDPEKQAAADVEMYNAGHKTIFDVLYSQNKDPEQHFRELEEQNKRLAKVGMPAPGMAPGMPVAGQTGKAGQNEQQQNGQAPSPAGESEAGD